MVDSWLIPDGYDLLKIEDFDGDDCSDFLWYDTYNGRLVLWSHGAGYDNEVELGEWNGMEHVVAWSNINGLTGCEIVFTLKGDSNIYVSSFVEGVWETHAIWDLDTENWEIITAAGVSGSRWDRLLLRHRIEREKVHYIVSDGIEGSPYSAHWEIDPNLTFEYVLDFDGDGREDFVFSERRFDAGIQRDKKFYTVVHMDDTWEPTITEFELPVEWEMQKFR